MADSVIKSISKNLQSTYNGQIITYPINGSPVANTITCELPRTIVNINNRYPYLSILGPMCEVDTRTNSSQIINANYILLFIDDRINDEYSDTQTIEPFGSAMSDIFADLQRISQLDIYRGGYAIDTFWKDFYTDVVMVAGVEHIALIQHLEIKTEVSISNPYNRG
jgi:hypothetical protein